MHTEKNFKYLYLLLAGLALFVFGSLIGMQITYLFANGLYDLSYEEARNSLYLLSNYYSNEMHDEFVTIGEYAKDFFRDNPMLFSQAKTLMCINQFVSYMPVIVFIIIALFKDIKKDLKGMKKETGRNLLIVLVGSVILFASTILIANIYSLLGDEGQSENQNIIELLMRSNGLWLMLFCVVILAPFVEEFIFRKLIIDTCEKTFNLKPWIAIAISAILFAFIHVSDLENIKYIFQYLALSVPLTLVYHYSKNNVCVSFLVHLINNLIAAISVLLSMWLV